MVFWRRKKESKEDVWELLMQYKGKAFAMEERKELERQRTWFKKRSNDLHLISYRSFVLDDSLTRVTQVVDGMERRMHQKLLEMARCLQLEQPEEEKKKQIEALLNENKIILNDLQCFLQQVLSVQQEGQRTSLFKIGGIIQQMEKIYR